MKYYIPSFEPKGHIYQSDEGEVLPSVTTIIKDSLKIYQYKSYGPSVAATRGTYVHLACQMYDENDLDESTIDPVVAPYLESYKLALKKYGINVEANELMRYHPTLKFAGSIDKVVMLDGKRTIIDIKTGKEECWHKWQTGAYAELLKAELGPLERADLYIKPDSFYLARHTCATDARDFRLLRAEINIPESDTYTKEETAIITASNNLKKNNGYNANIRRIV
jgi:hypothetical protein